MRTWRNFGVGDVRFVENFSKPLEDINDDLNDWEQRFPTELKQKYFQLRRTAVLNPTPHPNPTPAPALSPAQAPAPAPTTQGVMVRNTNYKDELFGRFKNTGIKAKQVRGYCDRNNIAFERSHMGCDRCLSFHVTGTCNTACANAADHCPHEADADQTLAEWCALNWRSE